MSEIYSKRDVWYVSTPGKDIQVFSTELEAKESLGYKEPLLKTCECEDCECDPCECEEDE